MNITEELKKLAQKFTDMVENISLPEAPDISVRKTFSSGARFSLRIRPSKPDLNLEGLSREELKVLLEEYQQKLEALRCNEPEEDNSDSRIAWEDEEEDLKDQIRDIENALDDRECDLQDQLEELEEKLDDLQDIEPEEENAKAHEAWEALVEALEAQIDKVQDALDAL